MDAYAAVRSRVAVREFTERQVPDNVLKEILLAARGAPSQRKRQPWHFVVVRNKEKLQRIGDFASSGRFIADAPMAIAIAMDGTKLTQVDAARAIQNIVLVAWTHGVGTVYVHGVDRDAVKLLLDIPQDFELITVMPYGYPTDAAKSVKKRRKSLHEIAHVERYGQSYTDPL